jgi:nitrite reductase/ring-hydroxylating ferredoxin subunit
MTPRVQSPNAPYSGYLDYEEPKEDEELTHVGPRTPCGEYMRRFWQPLVFMDELKDLPVRVRILGEDLVAFRDGSGQVGVLNLHCSHRGASLEFGQIAEKGIRCCYHGWLYDIDGRILDTPGERADSPLKDRFYHGAYPTHVFEGLVFVYMGPADKKPEFPIYDTYVRPDYRPWVGMRHPIPCNWLQIKENCMDPAHLSFLHMIESNGNRGFPKELKLTSEFDYLETPIGMVYFDTRRIKNRVWVRMCDFICPNIHQFGPFTLKFDQTADHVRPEAIHFTVPIDDTNTMSFRMRCVRKDDDRPLDLMGYGQVEGPYEERQRVPGDYDAQVSQRSIAIHALEHLGGTDRGVVMLRRLIRSGIQAVRAGQDPKGIVRRALNHPIHTYTNDTIVELPLVPEPEAAKVVREIGRKIAKDYVARA